MTVDPPAAVPVEPEAPFAARSPVRAAVEVAAMVVFFLGLTLLGDVLGRGTAVKLEHPLRSVVSSALMMLTVAALLSWRDAKWQRSLGVQKLPWKNAVALAVIGLVGSYAVSAVGSSLFFAISGAKVEDMAAAKAEVLGKLAAIEPIEIPFLVITAGFWEELVFRGFVLGRLRRALGAVTHHARQRDVAAVVLGAAFFASGHAYQGGVGVAQTFALGCAFGALTLKSRSIWPAVAVHTAIDGFSLVALKVLQPVLQQVLHGQGFGHLK